jgi:hypothetical protein
MKTAEDAEYAKVFAGYLCYRIINDGCTQQSVDSQFLCVLGVLCGCNFSFLSSPVADFLQPFAPCVLEQAHPMAGVFELVDIGPNFSLPSLLVGG